MLQRQPCLVLTIMRLKLCRADNARSVMLRLQPCLLLTNARFVVIWPHPCFLLTPWGCRLHALVIARDTALQGPSDLTAEHLPLLLSMQVRLQLK